MLFRSRRHTQTRIGASHVEHVIVVGARFGGRGLSEMMRTAEHRREDLRIETGDDGEDAADERQPLPATGGEAKGSRH